MPPKIHPGAQAEHHFWLHVDKRGPNECWLYNAAVTNDGYCWFTFSRKKVRVHRFSYELFVGKIPDGFTVDHTCHNRDESCSGGKTCPHRRCVNPQHLEAVPSIENAMRGKSIWAKNARKTHCKHGHSLLDDSNVMIKKGTNIRVCLACRFKRSEDARKRQGLFKSSGTRGGCGAYKKRDA